MKKNVIRLSLQCGDLVHKITTYYGSKMKSMYFYGTKCAWREVHGRSIAKHVSHSRHIYLSDDLIDKSFFYLFNAVLSPINLISI